MNLDLVIFFISAAVAVFGATMMITQRNPVAAVLYMILSLVAQAVLYIQLGALFVAALLIIVYAGAILVLFLFVIMLLNLRGNEDLGESSPAVSKLSIYTISILMVAELVFIIKSAAFPSSGQTGMMNISADAAFGSVEEVATLLFTKYLYPFELTSILLLAAIVGSVVMARGRKQDSETNNDVGSPTINEAGE